MCIHFATTNGSLCMACQEEQLCYLFHKDVRMNFFSNQKFLSRSTDSGEFEVINIILFTILFELNLPRTDVKSDTVRFDGNPVMLLGMQTALSCPFFEPSFVVSSMLSDKSLKHTLGSVRCKKVVARTLFFTFI